MNPVVIYRSCDRPKYVAHTLPLLIERTSGSVPILIYDNSSYDRRDQVKGVVDQVESNQVVAVYDEAARIGGTLVVMRGVEEARSRFPDVDSIMVVDDDVVVPPTVGDVSWDSVLSTMLDAGWCIAGHPWSDDFRSKAVTSIGGVRGYAYDGIAGGCSSFALDFYDRHPMKQLTLIRGYNEWMVRWSRRNCGYSHDYSMIFEHIDRPEHPLSLRDTEYDEWSNAMYGERFSGRRPEDRPKGSAGVW